MPDVRDADRKHLPNGTVHAMKIFAFPPAGQIIERTDRRLVQVCKTPEGFSIDVWIRQVEGVRPTTLGGWYCSPDAGINLSQDAAKQLHLVLGALL
jgi:hypothetical protein